VIRPGEEWGAPLEHAPDLDASGSDCDLATAISGAPAGALVRFRPSDESDLARSVGLAAMRPARRELPMDALTVRTGDDATRLAVNMVVLGPAPDRLRRIDRLVPLTVSVDGNAVWSDPASTVVVATGQFLRTRDVVPRGHPGDGRLEVQVYSLAGRERAAMRKRLATGTHLPHPRITQRVGGHVEVHSERPLALELDGRAGGLVTTLTVDVAEGAYRLVV